MFSADKYVLEFIQLNVFSLTILFGFLKILAQRSESTLDDNILSYLTGFLKRKKSEEPEEPVEQV
jgi:hypothetical protein